MNKYSKLAQELCIENYKFAAFWLVKNSSNLIYLTISPLSVKRGGGKIVK